MRCDRREKQLDSPTPHPLTLRSGPESALDAAARSLTSACGVDVRLALVDLAHHPIGDLDEERLAGAPGAEDVMAGVVLRFDGSLPATALLSFEPEDALAWLRTGAGAEDPIARFVDRGASLLGAVVGELARAARRSAEPGRPVLEERPLPAALRATHAPPDTVVLSLAAELSSGELCVPIGLYVLLEPKLLDGLRSVLLEPKLVDAPAN